MDISASSSTPLAVRLQTVLTALRATLGAWGLEAALAVLLYRRIGVVMRQIDGLLRRFRAGTMRPPRQRVTATPTPRPCVARTKTPRRRGWLLRAGRHHAAVFTVQLEALLGEAEMAALLAASPAAVRLLRPLCRALAVDLPSMRPAARPAVIRLKRPRTRPPLPDLGRIPLPRGVLTAARRQGFGKW